MIDVVATLPRGPVYLAGETIHCIITFSNSALPEYESHGEQYDVLAWASVQIHCQRTVSETRIVLPSSTNLSTEEVSTTGCETSFVPNKGEKGCTVLSTKPKILFCDLKLAPGESKQYEYKDIVPADSPPSYRGQAIKYSYKITIGTQRLNQPTKLLRIPIRVMVLFGLNDTSVYNENEVDVAPTNPFLKHSRKENSILDMALQVLSTVTTRKTARFYNITNVRGKVARFHLFKNAYRLGEDINGVFDFSGGSVACVQLSVSLQSEESVAEECCRKKNQPTSITFYGKQQEMCLHTQRTHISIPVPLTITPGFITDIVCLRWRLHFEFVTVVDEVHDSEQIVAADGCSMWQGSPVLNVETMVWDLPIKIFPTSPIHAWSATLLKSEEFIQV
ncbi:RAB6A-GEF complex partner protein 2 [Octopus sinensis]|uniref:RAB6A-GEF complex partner protein 2 n=1 Tax=Octopus sinensis TaxID=2607531 RepID=A0A6P7SZA1_9MOLL|nr:RAB6A-GEF complex partner protein 2 [Octopus sinensis]XP_029643733.1 RAB6A-GEF complex partner protein 2 [Octopus sinensis]XP_029643734.1 RAB6A-GEF complex partner protein 2 [Octopus sinensis]XP_029643735.1 RAB6A-GEF complex partner protein 2 [Octopus sinensis]XP_036363910.1 RAB6A-GEF complex partner protein 2 [Octopus sinensis]